MLQGQRASPELEIDAIRRASAHLPRVAASLPSQAVQALANEVVERLPANLEASGKVSVSVTPEEIERLASALVSEQPDAAAILISKIRAKGASVADVYLLHLAAAARRLGEKWQANEVSFLEVTIGTGRILAIMRGMREMLKAKRPYRERAAIFAAVPGEQHTIGITMASDLFRQEGWDIQLLLGETHEEILDTILKSDALVVCLTAHGTSSIAALVRLIAGIRILNPAVMILIGGKIVEEASDIIELSGADGVATDYPTALNEVKRLYELATG